MPNWVTNILTINASDDIIAKIKEEVKTEENNFDFQTINSVPTELDGQAGHQWRLDNWGTKWNSSEIYVLDDGFIFNTAWGTPFELMLSLSKKYSDIEFNVKYSDEDFGYNVGEYTLLNGNETFVNVPNGGTKRAYELALDIQGDDYYLSDNLCDLEEMDTYAEIMVEIAYARKYYPFEDCEYPDFILDKFKELALADENYELVIVIQQELDKIEEEN